VLSTESYCNADLIYKCNLTTSSYLTLVNFNSDGVMYTYGKHITFDTMQFANEDSIAVISENADHITFHNCTLMGPVNFISTKNSVVEQSRFERSHFMKFGEHIALSLANRSTNNVIRDNSFMILHDVYTVPWISLTEGSDSNEISNNAFMRGDDPTEQRYGIVCSNSSKNMLKQNFFVMTKGMYGFHAEGTGTDNHVCASNIIPYEDEGSIVYTLYGTLTDGKKDYSC